MTAPFTRKDLSDFTGEPEEYYNDYSDTVINQSYLLFKLATCLSELPEDPDQFALATNAVMDMAFHLYEGKKFAKVKMNPFSSEMIGSYSYSKASQRVQGGLPTEVGWFDLATQTLGVCDLLGGTGSSTSGGIEVFEHDGSFVPGNFAGNQRILSPNDLKEERGHYDPSGRGM